MFKRDKEKHRIYMKKYYATHPAYRAGRHAYGKDYYWETHEARRAYYKKWYEQDKLKNPEKYLALHKKYREANREKLRAYRNKRYYENSKEYRIYANAYCKKQYENNINYRITRILRSRIFEAIKEGKGKKNNGFYELLGTDIFTCRKHLEKQFKSGMSWDNHGKWHIDHIRPLALFDLTKKKEQFKAFNYKNLQPLWAQENLIKSKKVYA